MYSSPCFSALSYSLFPYYVIISRTWRRAAHAGWGNASRAPWAAQRGFSNGHLLCRLEVVPADTGAHVNVVWLVACMKLWRSGELCVSFRIQINAILQVELISSESVWGIRDHEKIKQNAFDFWSGERYSWPNFCLFLTSRTTSYILVGHKRSLPRSQFVTLPQLTLLYSRTWKALLEQLRRIRKRSVLVFTKLDLVRKIWWRGNPHLY